MKRPSSGDGSKKPSGLPAFSSRSSGATKDFCLKSWPGDPNYKGFNTPFRDTQFAVMALSLRYPGPGGKGWGAAYRPPPEELHLQEVDRFLSEADQYWDLPSEGVLGVLRQEAIESDQPLVRHAALAALGRVADPKALEAMVAALSAPTKVVQITAAWALREIAVRRAIGKREIAQALSGTDERTRWAASRVFNQHFRDLTRDRPLMETLVRNLDDPVPHIRYQAAAGLWRWYYWRVDDEVMRGKILEALCTRLGREDVAMVRRGISESIYDLLDETTGYLRAWVKASSATEDRQMIEEAYQAVVR